MKILFAADLHLNIPDPSRRTGRTTFGAFAESVVAENPDAVVIGGDIGVPERAGDYLLAIRRVVGDRPLALCLGNHDFWVPPWMKSEFSSLQEVIERYWSFPAREVGAVLLDEGNADLGELIVAGGYGHFDLGLAVPDLHLRGNRITERVYLAGIGWNDFVRIPNCATRLQVEAREQAAGIAKRVDEAIGSKKRVLVAIHTCPWWELNGHPLTGGVEDILSAYSGNSMVGLELEQRASAIEFLICGHTHMPVRERKMHGIAQVLNVGTDYGYFRGVIYDTSDRLVRWVGEQF